MSTLSQLRELISQIEEEQLGMTEIISEMKTAGGHLNNFGDDFVMLCRKYNIQQSKVARAVGVAPTSVNRRYQRPLSRTDFFHPRPE